MPSRFLRIGRSATGLGLFATKPIKRAVHIAAYRGRRLSYEEAEQLDARGAKFLFEINSRCTIDGSPRWNLGRYVNHSCRPNAKAVGRKGGIVFVASRRIEPGEDNERPYIRDGTDVVRGIQPQCLGEFASRIFEPLQAHVDDGEIGVGPRVRRMLLDKRREYLQGR